MIRLLVLLLLCFYHSYGQKSNQIFSKTGQITIDKTVFDKIPNNVKIIGLGEFTHGGREVVLYKTELCKYLIENQSVKQIIFEYSDINLRPINNYLLDDNQKFSDEKIKSLVNAQLKNSIFFTEEYIDFFIWLKHHNLKSKQKVKFRGFDTIVPVPIPYLTHNYLTKIDTNFVNKNIERWALPHNDSLAISNIYDWFEKNKDKIKSKLKEEDFQLCSMDIRNAKAYITQRHLKKRHQDYETYRDSLMAVNVCELADSKSVVWAHNAHILPITDYYKKEDKKTYYQILTKRLGSFLREKIWKSVLYYSNNLFQRSNYSCSKKRVFFKRGNFYISFSF
ncbi:hypothetical protein CGC58_03120 [Capnocytophaga stomatis]|uniref:Erythromycin esterase n=1 Tax=Capnocytophaga stomatis TaxID=1848904 RepID=A0A250FXU1_9FLAO|nr:erythromycin esterase family protein [Capnocytophaga stomatis]ATA88806.1 hypothetical protein CGC58_03120 [Capnocytophaga stomatis]